MEIQDEGTRSSEGASELLESSSEHQFEKASVKSELSTENMPSDTNTSTTRKKISVSREERMKNACHMPVVTNSRKRCAVCSTHSKESRTKFMCKTCKVGLCLRMGSNCFELFHAE